MLCFLTGGFLWRFAARKNVCFVFRWHIWLNVSAAVQPCPQYKEMVYYGRLAKKVEILWNKISLTGCKRSSLNAPGSETSGLHVLLGWRCRALWYKFMVGPFLRWRRSISRVPHSAICYPPFGLDSKRMTWQAVRRKKIKPIQCSSDLLSFVSDRVFINVISISRKIRKIRCRKFSPIDCMDPSSWLPLATAQVSQNILEINMHFSVSLSLSLLWEHYSFQYTLLS